MAHSLISVGFQVWFQALGLYCLMEILVRKCCGVSIHVSNWNTALPRQFPPPLEFRTLSSVPVSSQQVNMTWTKTNCANISAFTPLQHRHIPSSWPRGEECWDTLSDLSKKCQRCFTQIFMPWQEEFTAQSCFISFFSFGALDSETWLLQAVCSLILYFFWIRLGAKKGEMLDFKFKHWRCICFLQV